MPILDQSANPGPFFQSCAKPGPIHPILCQSSANPMPICQSISNPPPICQSITNLPIRHQSANPTPGLISQSIANPPTHIPITERPLHTSISANHQNSASTRIDTGQYGGQSRTGTGNKLTVEVWPKCLDGGRLRKSKLQRDASASIFTLPLPISDNIPTQCQSWTNLSPIHDQSSNRRPIEYKSLTNSHNSMPIFNQLNPPIRCPSRTNSVTIC